MHWSRTPILTSEEVRNNPNGIKWNKYLEDFIWKEITLHGFNDDETYECILVSTDRSDMLKVRVKRWKLEYDIYLDLYAKSVWPKSIRKVTCWTDTLYFDNSDTDQHNWCNSIKRQVASGIAEAMNYWQYGDPDYVEDSIVAWIDLSSEFFDHQGKEIELIWFDDEKLDISKFTLEKISEDWTLVLIVHSNGHNIKIEPSLSEWSIFLDGLSSILWEGGITIFTNTYTQPKNRERLNPTLWNKLAEGFMRAEMEWEIKVA